MTIRIIEGNALNRIKDLSDNFVSLIITSPPYGSLVDYNHPNQIGFGQTLEHYHRDLNEIWDDCIRILQPGCRMVINIGDEFVKGGKSPYHIIPHRTAILDHILSNSSMIYTGSIIWRKVNGKASGVNGKILGSVNSPRNGHFFVNREYLMTFKKLGDSPNVTKKQKEESKFSKKERSIWFRDTWDIPPERQNLHPAMFPLEIPSRLIQMYSFVGEMVFDPFCGSGTALIAAELLGRHSTGIELGWSKDWQQVLIQKVKDCGLDGSLVTFTNNLNESVTGNDKIEASR